MKSIFYAILSLAVVCVTVSANAQDKAGQSDFGKLPSIVSCDPIQLLTCFDVKEGGVVNISFSDNFRFSGKVVSNVRKYDNLHSVVIRSENLENTLFQISKQTGDDKSIRFVGRMISPGSPEGYKISMDEKGNYSLVKFETSHIVQDCSYQQ